MSRKSATARYFDCTGEIQCRPFPKKWRDLSRFKIGDRIEFLESLKVATKYDEHKRPLEWSDLKGQIGIVEKVNAGYGSFPPRFFDPSGGDDPVWIGEHTGWLTVKFPFDVYRGPRGEYQARACCAEDENKRWRKAGL